MRGFEIERPGLSMQIGKRGHVSIPPYGVLRIAQQLILKQRCLDRDMRMGLEIARMMNLKQ